MRVCKELAGEVECEMKTREEIVSEHEDMIYPTVRVHFQRVGGSGLVIYSKPVSPNSTRYETYIMTCHHVVDEAIKFIEKWSALAGRMIKVEDRAEVSVEVFEYEGLSRLVGGTTYKAEIVAWDRETDIALLKVKSGKKFPYVAKLYPKGKEEDVLLGSPTIAVGCSLGHEPIICYGSLTGKHDRIKNKEYWMSTADIIFGNSGGAEFLGDTHEYIGITARVSGIQLGFGINIVTWMGFFVPITTIYKFFDEQIFQFIYDPNYTSKQCEESRKKKREEEERKLYLPPDVTAPGSRKETLDSPEEPSSR